MAEIIARDGSAIANAELRTSWDDFCEWFIAQSN
jgi:hypothetical protein